MTNSWTCIGDDISPLLNNKEIYLALDVETSGLHFQDDVLGVAVAWREDNNIKSSYLLAPVGQSSLDTMLYGGNEIDIDSFLTEIHKRHYLIYHNEAFDNRACFRLSKSFPRRMTHDTQHIASLIGWQDDRSLRGLYSKYVGSPLSNEYVDMKSKRNRLSQLPSATVARYGRTDAENTLELFERLRPLAKKTVSTVLYHEDREYARLVMRMIRRGIRLDFRWCLVTEKKFVERMVEIETELRGEGLKDIGSNPSVATFLFKQMGLSELYAPATRVVTSGWPGGVPSVSSEVLENYKQHKAVGLILEWRQLRGAISKWLHEYREHASIDGYVHALLDPFGTVSSRMAASNPNVMAIPMEDRGTAFGSMQGMFSERKGGIALASNRYNRLWSVDFSQMETRLAAVLAREGRLLSILNTEKDPYEEMSVDLWGVRDLRYKAKRATLASIYNVGADKLAYSMGVPIDDATNVLNTFRRAYPRLRLASQLAEQEAAKTGYIKVFNGRNRYFGPEEKGHKAFNQKVQTTVAEILKRAMLDIDSWIPDLLRLQIHDSVVLFIPTSTPEHLGGKELVKGIREIMEDAVPGEYRDLVKFPTKAGPWE